jgi:hypothetical protein
MKAYEQTKGARKDLFQRGMIEMCVYAESEAELGTVDAALRKSFNSTDCMDEVGNGFEVAFIIDRDEKADFMAAYKEAKKAL